MKYTDAYLQGAAGGCSITLGLLMAQYDLDKYGVDWLFMLWACSAGYSAFTLVQTYRVWARRDRDKAIKETFE